LANDTNITGNTMNILYFISGLALIISFILSWQKSLLALRIALKRFLHVLPDLLTMVALVSLVLYIIPDTTISRYLGQENHMIATGIALTFGSITLMPGFIAFPLCGLFLQKGVPHFVLAAFTTSLMMVGIVTLPVEKAYFGIKTAVIRNLLGLLIALIVTLTIGFVYGELY